MMFVSKNFGAGSVFCCIFVLKTLHEAQKLGYWYICHARSHAPVHCLFDKAVFGLLRLLMPSSASGMILDTNEDASTQSIWVLGKGTGNPMMRIRKRTKAKNRAGARPWEVHWCCFVQSSKDKPLDTGSLVEAGVCVLSDQDKLLNED